MLMNYKKSIYIFFLLFVFATLSYAQKIGIVVSVEEGNAWVERASQQVPLEIKTPILLSDTIVTNDKGRVQILFDDDTSLAIGLSSSVQIDNFVFNTNAKPQFGASMLKGVSRIITGQIVKQNKEGFALKTPLATVGIRGTIATLLVEENNEEIQLNQIEVGSEVVVTDNDGNETILDTPGFSVNITPSTGVSPPFTTPQANKDSANTSLKEANSETPETAEEETNKISSLDNSDNISNSFDENTDNSNINLDQITTDGNNQRLGSNISGTYAGKLTNNSADFGTFGFDINLSSGLVSNGTMTDSTSPTVPLISGSGTAQLNGAGNAEFNIANFEGGNTDTLVPGATMTGTANQDGTTNGTWVGGPTSPNGTFIGTKE